jgi:hypothetical protein
MEMLSLNFNKDDLFFSGSTFGCSIVPEMAKWSFVFHFYDYLVDLDCFNTVHVNEKNYFELVVLLLLLF